MTERATMSGYWDAQSERYDEDEDHGLRDPAVRAAWRRRLLGWLPAGREHLDVLDLGCGTGSLSLLLAEAGHRVTGVDLAPRMVDAATAKCAPVPAANRPEFLLGDASRPPVPTGSTYDVVLARHLAWTLPDPAVAVAGWAALVRPGGRLVLVEGRWGIPRGATPDEPASTPYAGEHRLPWGRGVGADDLRAAVSPLARVLQVEPLHEDPVLWGHPVEDERYALVAEVREA